MISTRRTGRPGEVRWPARLPPTATSCRPKVVRCTTEADQRPRARRRSSTTIGMPEHVAAAEREQRPGCGSVLSCPSASTSAMPRPPTSSAERRDDGLQADDRDERAVERAGGGAGHQRHAIAQPDAGAEVERDDGGGQRHHRADRQVDALGADDQRHAEGDDARRARPGRAAYAGWPAVQEVVGEDDVEEQQHDHGGVDAVVLQPTGEPVPGRATARPDGDVSHRRPPRRPTRSAMIVCLGRRRSPLSSPTTAPAAQHDDPVGALDELLQVRGDEHDREALLRPARRSAPAPRPWRRRRCRGSARRAAALWAPGRASGPAAPSAGCRRKARPTFWSGLAALIRRRFMKMSTIASCLRPGDDARPGQAGHARRARCSRGPTGPG